MPQEVARQVLVPYEELLGRPAEDVAADLDTLHGLLTEWNRAHNLVSRETLGAEFWTRHVADSLRLLPLIRPEDRRITDIGSGGGFPALPLAIALKGTPRTLRLLESVARKASFLRTAVRNLRLPATVATVRAEQDDSRETPDIVTARAVAPLADLLGLAQPLFGPATRGLFHKGREYDEELRVAAQRWSFSVRVHTGGSDAGGVLLEITNLEPAQ